MSIQRAAVRAVAFASAIAMVVLGARLALATLPLSRAATLATDALASSMVLAIAAIAIASVASAPIRARLGLGRSALAARHVAIGALGVVALSYAAETTLRWFEATSPAIARFDDAFAGLDLQGAIYPLLVLTLASAFGEELFFRGLLQRGLVRRIGAPAGIAVAALAFGAAHGDWLHGASAALLGTFLGVIAHRADSIRPAIAAHALNNAVALLQKLVEIQPPDGPIATPAGFAASLTLSCVSLYLVGRASAAGSLQSPDRRADDGPQSGCAGG